MEYLALLAKARLLSPCQCRCWLSGARLSWPSGIFITPVPARIGKNFLTSPWVQRVDRDWNNICSPIHFVGRAFRSSGPPRRGSRGWPPAIKFSKVFNLRSFFAQEVLYGQFTKPIQFFIFRNGDRRDAVGPRLCADRRPKRGRGKHAPTISEDAGRFTDKLLLGSGRRRLAIDAFGVCSLLAADARVPCRRNTSWAVVHGSGGGLVDDDYVLHRLFLRRTDRQPHLPTNR